MRWNWTKQNILQFLHANKGKLINICIIAMFAFTMSFLVEWVARGGAISEIVGWVYYSTQQYINASLFIFFITLILYAVLNSTGWAVFSSGVFFAVIAGVNYYKVFYRDEPLFPWDFISFREAARISSSINIQMTYQIGITFVIVLAVFGGCLFLNRKPKKDRRGPIIPTIRLSWKYRLVGGALLCAMTFVYTDIHFLNASYMGKKGITTSQWRQGEYYKINGFLSSILMNMQYAIVQEPEHYSKETVEQILSAIPKSEPESEVQPNIILVMDESYGDATLWPNLTTDKPFAEQTEKLKENNVSGEVLTSSFAGGTSVSEFEVLTGASYSFLPSGCTPYQQYLNQPMDSYVSFLKNSGYTAVALHAFGRNFWNRDTAYKSLGFDRFYAEDDFVDPERKRQEEYISDAETIKKTIAAYEENKEEGKPYFSLTVTMQNHQAYHWYEYPEYDKVHAEIPGLNPDLVENTNTYLTGLRDADNALEYLIQYFSNVEEPTIIVFFGDHLARVGEEPEETYIPYGYISETDSVESVRKMHTPPFFIWDNYRQVKAEPVSISMYQLMPYMTKLYGLDRPLYFDYLNQQAEYYKGNSLNVFLDKDGNTVEELDPEAKKYYDMHRILQYDIMFGKGYGVEELFAAEE